MSRCLGLQTCFVANFEFKIAKIPLTEASKCQRCWGKHMSLTNMRASEPCQSCCEPWKSSKSQGEQSEPGCEPWCESWCESWESWRYVLIKETKYLLSTPSLEMHLAHKRTLLVIHIPSVTSLTGQHPIFLQSPFLNAAQSAPYCEVKCSVEKRGFKCGKGSLLTTISFTLYGIFLLIIVYLYCWFTSKYSRYESFYMCIKQTSIWAAETRKQTCIKKEYSVKAFKYRILRELKLTRSFIQEHAWRLLEIFTHFVKGRTQSSYWQANCHIRVATNNIWTTHALT